MPKYNPATCRACLDGDPTYNMTYAVILRNSLKENEDGPAYEGIRNRYALFCLS